MRNRHTGRRRRSADIGIGRQYDVFQIKLEKFPENKTKSHIDKNHNKTKYEQQGSILNNFGNRRGNTDNKEEKINKVRSDLL